MARKSSVNYLKPYHANTKGGKTPETTQKGKESSDRYFKFSRLAVNPEDFRPPDQPTNIADYVGRLGRSRKKR